MEAAMARLLLALLILPALASASDDSQISFLEQEVRNLQRQMQALSRQVDELRTRPDRPGPQSTTSPAAAPVASSPRWLDATRWKQLRPGMSELEVIGALGPPTSMREEGGDRVLLYAMEIGASGFLGGSVKLRDRAVVEVAQPTLK
jgi:hypothetical protein